MIRVVVLSLILPWLIPATSDEVTEGSGGKVSETREVERVTGIDLRIPARLRVAIGEPTPVTIEAHDNVMRLIKTEVRDGTLVISSDRDLKTDEAPDIELTVADLTALSIVGAGDVWVDGLNNKALSVTASGATDVHLAGKTLGLTLTANGAADVFAYELDVHVLTATLTGAADAKVSVAESLIATLTGSCDLHYKGSPKVIKTIVGGGDVKQVEAGTGM